MVEPLTFIVHHFIIPSKPSDLASFYLAWILTFVVVNILWDIKSSKTGTFHILDLKNKGEILHPATAFCSSLILLLSVVNPRLWEISKETYLPVIIAGASGIFNTIPSLCPYRSKTENSAADTK
jgi:hypothetical protein